MSVVFGKRSTKLVALVAIVAVVGGWFTYQHFDDKKTGEQVSSPEKGNTVSVDEQGGTLTFPHGVTVTVPKGAVDAKSELSVSAPRELKSNDAGPLSGMRSAGVAFDVSLARGDVKDIQPRASLVVTVPRGGVYAPSAPKAAHVLPYTANPAGGYLLIPVRVDQKYVSIEMSHLSPKYVVYVTDAELLKSFDAEKAKSTPADCAQQVTVNKQKVKFGSRTTGWSLKSDSPVYACLYEGENGYVRVGVINRVDYVLAVAAARDVRLAASAGTNAETEAIKALATRIFNLEKVRKYVGLDEKLVGSIALQDLPATIELQGDVHTYLAESVWRALTVAVMVFVGKDSQETAKIAKALIESVDVLGCLQDKLHADDKADWDRVIRTITDCSGPILEALAKFIPELDILKRAQAVWSMIVALQQSAVRFGNGIQLQFRNTLRVQVVAVAPPAPACPSGAELERILMAGFSDPQIKAWNAKILTCDKLWALGTTEAGYGDPQTDSLTGFLIHLESGRWKMVEASQDMGDSPYCDDATMPAHIKEKIDCR